MTLPSATSLMSLFGSKRRVIMKRNGRENTAHLHAVSHAAILYSSLLAIGQVLMFTGTAPDPPAGFTLPCRFSPCPSGGSVNMSFSIPGQLIQGTATIDGLPSSVPPSPNSQFNFHGSADIPSVWGPSQRLSITYPFTFDGTLQTATTLLNLDGDGIGTLRLVSSGTGVFVAGGTLHFAAIPEPSTLLPLASGIGALGWWRKRA